MNLREKIKEALDSFAAMKNLLITNNNARWEINKVGDSWDVDLNVDINDEATNDVYFLCNIQIKNSNVTIGFSSILFQNYNDIKELQKYDITTSNDLYLHLKCLVVKDTKEMLEMIEILVQNSDYHKEW